MKVTGITAEYNPLHNGHVYNLKEARRITGSDYIIAVMSGDFVQRGSAAICDKYSRARMALQAGADLVLELPACYCVSSAEYFASAAVAIFDKLAVVDNICFGSEYEDIDVLGKIAQILLKEPPEYRRLLKQGLKSGKSFPVSRADALYELNPFTDDLVMIMNSPNCILGIEYLKAAARRQSSIKTYAIRRYGSDYHDARFGSINPSALAIRTALHDCCACAPAENQMPDYAYDIISSQFNHTMPVYDDDFSFPLKYRLLLESSQSLTDYTDVSPALADRIMHSLNSYAGFTSFCDMLKTKEITHTRISRALLHILLSMKACDFNEYVENDYIDYVRVLGFKKSAQPLLKAIKANSSILLLSKLADGKKALSSRSLNMFNETNRASEIYNSAVNQKFGILLPNEFERKIEII